MKPILRHLVFLATIFILSTIVNAEDEAKKESKSNLEVNKSKIEAKDFEVSGIVTLKTMRGGKSAGQMYVILTSEKLMVGINSKMGDKEIDLKQYENKQVVVKGQNIETKEYKFDDEKGETKDYKITYINQLSSIELKDTKATSEKKHTPSLPDAHPRSDRFRCGGRESKFLAVAATEAPARGYEGVVAPNLLRSRLTPVRDRSRIRVTGDGPGLHGRTAWWAKRPRKVVLSDRIVGMKGRTR